MSIDLTNALILVLIMFRMTGMLMSNPIFSRSNVPTMANLALAFMVAVLLTGNVPSPAFPTPTLLYMVFWVLKELLVGILSGFMLQMFFSVFIVAGEVVDMQMGMSMAKAFDPGTNTSVSMSAQYFNVLFILVFFVSNGHLTFIQMMAQSFSILPMGSYLVNFEALYLLPQLFGNMFLLAVKLAMPVLVIEIVTTFAVGIIMRIIPQINVFVVNIQFKLLVGLFLLMVLVPPFSAFMENLFAICVENIQSVLVELAA